MTIEQQLRDLITSKEDMKTAIISKGVTPEGGLSTYADAIRQIEISETHKIKFGYNNGLTYGPDINTSRYKDMSNMFYECSNLKSIPQYNTSRVKDMSNMFYECSSLTTIPQLDTSKVTNMYAMFLSCSNLKSVPLLNLESVNNIALMFIGCENNLSELGGFKDLGKEKNLKGTTNYFLGELNKLTKESILNILNNLYDRAKDGYTTITLSLHHDVLSMLSDEEKAIATNKGWILG